MRVGVKRARDSVDARGTLYANAVWPPIGLQIVLPPLPGLCFGGFAGCVCCWLSRAPIGPSPCLTP